MALSTRDTNKCDRLKISRVSTTLSDPVSEKYERQGPIRQRERRLSDGQVAAVAARYADGATVYELAAEFGCNRETIGARLKRAGIQLRRQSPSPLVIDERVRLYERGASAATVGATVGYSPQTVLNHLTQRRVRTRGSHGRPAD